MKSYTMPIVSSLLGSAYAASHSVDVGEGGLVFSPNSTTAAVGDTVTFHFYPRAHGVARSSYSSPCAAIDNGFNSGFVQVASGESATTFTITINNTDPIWYYCPQGDHCQAGMVGVINPPSSGGETIGGFINAASTAGSSTVPSEVYGGMLSANGNGTSGGTVVGGSSSSASMASSSRASSMMVSSSQASSMMASSSKASFSMASSAVAAGGSSSHSTTASSASAASGTASHSSGSGSGSATSKAASATSSLAASTGAAVSSKTAGLANLGLGLLFGGWLFL